MALVNADGTTGSEPRRRHRRARTIRRLPPKPKNQNIRVSPAVLDAALKDGDALLQSLRTSPGGLTQAEAEERARTTGPNEVAQERRQGWPVRLLKIIRNPLVILLATLSAISFATGDARAGTVMAAMVVAERHAPLRSGGPCGRGGGETQGHDPCDRHRHSGWRREGDAAPGPGARRHHQAVRGRHDPRRRASALFERPLRQPGEPYRGVVPGRKVP